MSQGLSPWEKTGSVANATSMWGRGKGVGCHKKRIQNTKKTVYLCVWGGGECLVAREKMETTYIHVTMASVRFCNKTMAQKIVLKILLLELSQLQF